MLEPVTEEEEEELEEDVESSGTQPSTEVGAAQERRDLRSQLRDSINMTNVNALVNTDTEEAREKLAAILALVDEASKIHLTPLRGIAARPELTKPGGKPKQSKVELHTVSSFQFYRFYI
uniref:Uncharacterized protein n=1 Tax=Haemonchus contortus TaxID=6289 RepID=A0A7I4Y1V9_HAECO